MPSAPAGQIKKRLRLGAGTSRIRNDWWESASRQPRSLRIRQMWGLRRGKTTAYGCLWLAGARTPSGGRMVSQPKGWRSGPIRPKLRRPSTENAIQAYPGGYYTGEHQGGDAADNDPPHARCRQQICQGEDQEHQSQEAESRPRGDLPCSHGRLHPSPEPTLRLHLVGCKQPIAFQLKLRGVSARLDPADAGQP